MNKSEWFLRRGQKQTKNMNELITVLGNEGTKQLIAVFVTLGSTIMLSAEPCWDLLRYHPEEGRILNYCNPETN